MNITTQLFLAAGCLLLTSCFKDLSGEISEARKKIQVIDQEAADLRSQAELKRTKLRELKSQAAAAAPSAGEEARKTLVRSDIKRLKGEVGILEPRLDGYKAAAATYLKQNP